MRRNFEKFLLLLLLVISSISAFAMSPGQYTPPYGGAIRQRATKQAPEVLVEENDDTPTVSNSSTSILQQKPTIDKLPAVVLASVEHQSIPEAEPLVSQQVFLSTMSFLSAAGDVVSHKRHGGYANMMTGNIIRLGSSLAEHRWKDCIKSVTLLSCYMVGTVIFRSLLKHHRDRRIRLWWSLSSQQRDKVRKTTKSPLLVAPISLVIMVLGDLWNNMSILALAGGFINAATSHAAGGTVVFALTGHLSRVLTGLLDYQETKTWNKGIGASATVVTCFFAGAITTTLLWNHVGSKPFFVFIGLLYAGILSMMGLPKPEALEIDAWFPSMGSNSTLIAGIS